MLRCGTAALRASCTLKDGRLRAYNVRVLVFVFCNVLYCRGPVGVGVNFVWPRERESDGNGLFGGRLFCSVGLEYCTVPM